MTTKPESTATADIFAIANERVAYEYEVIHPGTKKGMGLFISMISIHSDAPKKVIKRIEDAKLKLMKKGMNFNADQMRQNSIDIIGACMTGWRWGLDADGIQASAGGEQLEFNLKNIRRVLEVDEIRDQLDSELMDDSNFFQS